ncbi:hypothetical protein V9T40_003383 [Parthenolecanium corni]|uniref:Uncharacterized protein n=1 Tax=Parthenolecanium corni TaxID=536013 RepID=A0AAN9TQI8_9HEMI
MKSLRHPDPLDQMPTGSLKPSGKRGEKIDSTVKSRLVDRAAEDTEDAKDVADKARDGLAQMNLRHDRTITSSATVLPSVPGPDVVISGRRRRKGAAGTPH